MTSFKFTDRTLKLIDNFARINSGMVFNQGKLLKTIEPTKAIYATAVVEDEIPSEFVVHDLSRFLGILGMHDKETLMIDIISSKMVNIVSKMKTTNYVMTKKDNVIHPEKDFMMPEVKASFALSAEQVDSIIKDAASLDLPHVVFADSNITITDLKNDTSDKHVIKVENTKNQDYTAVLKVDNFNKLLKGTAYEVNLSAQAAHFSADNGNLNYYMAVESWGKK